MPESDAFYRKASLDSGDVIRATLATETPVAVYDFHRGEVVDEILLMRGAAYPQRLRMIDGHDPVTHAEGPTIGSVVNVTRSGGDLGGDLDFSSTAGSIATLVREGHLTDTSIGGRREKVQYIERGKKASAYGKEYSAVSRAIRLVTKWSAKHLAIVGEGADPKAKISLAMRAYADPYGVAREMADTEQVQDTEVTEVPVSRRETPNPLTAEQIEALISKSVTTAMEVGLKDIERARLESIEKLTTEYKVIARGMGIPETVAEEVARQQLPLDKAMEAFSRHRGPDVLTFYGVESEEDKFRAAMSDGFLTRCGHAIEKPAKGHEHFNRMSLKEMARTSLARRGVNVSLMNDRDICRATFNDLSRASDGAAFHTTGNFANLLLDAMNKRLTDSYMEAPSTYQRWTRQAEPFNDFKTRNIIQLSNLGNLQEIPENVDYPEGVLTDNKETYRAYKRGIMVSLSWETWVNDDLGGFTRVVGLQGAAARRTVNASVYNILFQNAGAGPTMTDTGALFNSTAVTSAGGHANLVSTALATDSLNTAFTAFATRQGLNTETILNIAPRFLIVPFAYAATAWQLTTSPANPAQGGNVTGSSGVYNQYGPSGDRPLEVIYDALIDGNDSTSWYLAADPRIIGTIELAFLRGEETPVFEQETGFTNDTIRYKVRQSWGVGVEDWRGLYKSTG